MSGTGRTLPTPHCITAQPTLSIAENLHSFTSDPHLVPTRAGTKAVDPAPPGSTSLFDQAH